MELFDEIPCLSNDRIVLREVVACDAPAIAGIANDPDVNRYLPTFLIEQQYDARECVVRMRESCLVEHQSLYLAVALAEDPGRMLGIAEIYNYDEQARKASIGCRLSKQSWHMGIATQVAGLLRDYLIDQVHLRTITTHVMTQNTYSLKTVLGNGFVLAAEAQLEDWGHGRPVVVNKYVYERPDAHLETSPQQPNGDDLLSNQRPILLS